jgi:hypothetical protein
MPWPTAPLSICWVTSGNQSRACNSFCVTPAESTLVCELGHAVFVEDGEVVAARAVPPLNLTAAQVVNVHPELLHEREGALRQPQQCIIRREAPLPHSL